MSYALRNTIILLVTLFLFAGSAFAFIKFVQEKQIVELQTELEVQQQDYNTKAEIRDQYPALQERYIKARDIVQGYDKMLYTSNNPDDVYDYLSELNDSDLELFYDFTFVDSVQNDQYGVVNSIIAGTSLYTDLVTFINRIENSALLNKVGINQITPASGASLEGLENENYVNFSLKLQSFYQRTTFDTNVLEEDLVRFNPDISIFNPFKPLILNDIPENVDNLTDVERSRLLGYTGTRIFLVDQNGERKTLKIGDKVYLGYLKSIDTKNRQVIFSLNKGGIQELFTLEVEQ